MELNCETKILLINVYFPFYSISNFSSQVRQYCDTIGFIDFVVSENLDKSVLFATDMNCDIYNDYLYLRHWSQRVLGARSNKYSYFHEWRYPKIFWLESMGKCTPSQILFGYKDIYTMITLRKRKFYQSIPQLRNPLLTSLVSFIQLWFFFFFFTFTN